MPRNEYNSHLYPFAVTKVWRRQRDRAMRDAVLYPLTTPDAKRKESLKRIAPLVERLVRARRARFSALRAAGWCAPNECSDKRVLYALNCPPFSVTTSDMACNCRWYRWCPFCWAREVVGETYDRLEWTFFRSLGLQLATQAAMVRLNLIEGRHIQLIPRPYHLDVVVGETAPIIGAFRHYLPILGGFAMATIEPRPHAWEVTHRFIAVVNPDTPLIDIPVESDADALFELTRHNRVDRAVLARVTGSACSYPTQLMRGNSKDTAEILDLMEGRRFSVNYGCLRNRSYERLILPQAHMPEPRPVDTLPREAMSTSSAESMPVGENPSERSARRARGSAAVSQNLALALIPIPK